MANGKSQTAECVAWGQVKDQTTELINVFGSLLMLPLTILVGIGYGLRAGIIAGTEKGLKMFKEWGE